MVAMPEGGAGERADDAGRPEPTTDGGIALDGAVAAGDGGGATAEETPPADALDEPETADATDAERISIPLPRPGIAARIARRETRLTTRRGWTVGLTVVFAAFGLLLATFSGSGVAPTGYEPVVASYVELATFLVPLAALAFGHGAVVGAAERGRLGVVLTLPVSRVETAIGVFAGRAAVLGSAVVLGFGVPGLLLLREYGLAGWPTFAWFLFATVAVAVALLGIGVAISALAPTSTMALAGALLVWAWVALVHDLLAMGVLAALDGAHGLVAAAVAANPVSTYRLLALAPTDAGGAGLAAALEGGLSVGALVGVLLGWVALGVAVAAVAMRAKRI
ncbi:ABC-type transporter involved in multi-copper enzyme maturation permease [Halorubrum saccharovorum DSM 1137]|uniref:ABC-type transporter involved in multi-copper enzyme maturation permease n=2 Tax=Halorubrum saccharovorum TaxID=2248 RepID=M0DQ13_9EURY|nr:ABC-type transporter involved in multi-copper enzyme maturation permease [Halorubrum saccharovorum DSM 1137]